MPRCEGLPDGGCPGNKNDSSVKLGEGDLLLCPSCDATRFRQFRESKKSLVSVAQDSDANRAKKSRLKSVTKSSDGSVGTQQISDASADCPSQSFGLITSDVTGTTQVVFNELLLYSCYFRDRATADSLKKVIVGFYTPAEISGAKRKLIDLFGVLLPDNEFKTERRSSTQRTAAEAETDDIIGLLDALDQIDKLSEVKFGALVYDRLPRYGPEELNLCSIVDKQVRTEHSLTDISAKIDSLTTAISTMSSSSMSTSSVTSTSTVVDAVKDAASHMDNQLYTFTHGLQEQLSQLVTICSKSSETSRPVSNTGERFDRSRNVIITGIDESRDSNVWKGKVYEVLHIAAGKDVVISDAFRISGPYRPDKKRPILVKFQTAWDRRLAVSGSRKLASVDAFKSVYITADEPPDVRRRKTFDRLKARAEFRGRDVVVSSDGILSIDGFAVYSRITGRLSRGSVSGNSSQDGQ